MGNDYILSLTLLETGRKRKWDILAMCPNKLKIIVRGMLNNKLGSI